MNCNRRKVLKIAVKSILLAGLPLSAFRILDREAIASIKKDKGPRWAFVIDVNKCVGCGMCVKACKLENEVLWDANISRTWVERYVVRKDGRVTVDSPMGGRDGFLRNDPQRQYLAREDIAKAFFVPRLCNHCDSPPCVKVCPVGATYQTVDGVVLVDRDRCIGCRYCVTACPFGVRFFHPTLRVAEKCTFCYHRITKGMNSACVDACAFGARRIGDINDPNSDVHKIVTTERVAVLKPEYGTKPHVFYLGLDHAVK